MKYVILDISNRMLNRQDFLNQPKKLFVLPDNLPDFRLPRNELHNTNNRGGLAACMRPNLLGTVFGLPSYDVNIIGVPSISFVSNEPLTVEHIEEAFVGIYRLLDSNDFDEIVVPYKNGQPAFGGGIAGNIPANIQAAINKEFSLLEKFLKQPQLSDLPKKYQDAYQEGPLPLPLAPQTKLGALLDKPYPWLSSVIKSLTFLGIAIATYALLPVAMSFAAAATIGLLAGAIGVICQNVFLKGFFGENTIGFTVKGRLGWGINHLALGGSVLELFGLSYPYKQPLQKLEQNIATQLRAQLTPEQGQAPLSQEIEGLTRKYSKQMLMSYPNYFYRQDLEKVKTKEYLPQVPTLKLAS